MSHPASADIGAPVEVEVSVLEEIFLASGYGPANRLRGVPLTMIVRGPAGKQSASEYSHFAPEVRLSRVRLL